MTNYSDVEYAGFLDDRKSTTGFRIFVGVNLVSWRSKKQVFVVCLNVESKYRVKGRQVK